MVDKFLKADLKVPENNIQLLLGPDSKECTVPGNKSPVSPCYDFAIKLTDKRISKPTRDNIVDAILGLSTNPNIQHGDNIIIYFAGHGTTYNCADFFDKDMPAAKLGKIDALCPIDRGLQRTPSTETADTNDDKSSVTSDPQVPDISDREFNTILAEIARKKGNHITFILDCCHSAGATRGLENGGPKGGLVREISPLLSISDMFDGADETLKRIAGCQSIQDPRWRSNMDSHVVLAACKDYEKAREGEGDTKFSGVFTRALISAFKSPDLNDKSMTYYKLLKALPENPAQHPVIAGKHKHSRLWFQVQRRFLSA